MAITDNLKWQIDVNSRDRADNEFYNHVAGALMTKNSSPAVNTDQLFGAMDLDGVDDYFTQSFPAGLSATFLDSDFTIAVRFLLDTPDSLVIKKMLGIGNSGSTARCDIGITDTTDDYIAGGFDTPSGTDEFETSTVNAGDGKAHVAVWRRSGNNFTLWIDGVKTIDVTTAVGTMGSMNQINVGRRGGTAANQWYFPGKIYWAAIWDNDISDGDLATLHTSINPFLTEEDGDYFFGTAGSSLHFPPTGAGSGDQIIMQLTAGTALLVPTQADIVPEVMPATFSVWAWDVSTLTLLSRPDITVYIGQNRIVDTFTDTDGTALPDHTPDIDESTLGWAYAAENDTVAVPSSGVTIEGNKLRISAGGAGIVIETESTNQQVRVDIDVDATTQIHTIQFNWQDSANRLSLKINAADGTFQLNQRHLGVAYPGFASGTYDLSALGLFTIDIASVDGAIDVYCEDTQVITAAVPPRALATTATKVGLFSINQSGTYPIEFENFAANAEVPAEITVQTSRESYSPKPPVSRNLRRWSNGFGSAVWSKGGGTSTITPRFELLSIANAPDSLSRWTEGAGTAHALHGDSFQHTIGQAYVSSIFCKENGASAKRYLAFLFYDTFAGSYKGAIFNAATGAWTSVSSGVTTGQEEVATGVWRPWASVVAGVTGSSIITQFRLTSSASDVYANQTGSGGSILIGGAQLDLGTTPARYSETEHVPLRSDQVIVRGLGAHNPCPYPNDLSNAAWTKTRSAAPGTSLTLSGSASRGWAGATLYKFREDGTASNNHYAQTADNSILLNPAGLISTRFLAASDGGQDRHVQCVVYGDSFSSYFQYKINLVTGATILSAVAGTGALHSVEVVQVDTLTIEGTAGCPVWEIIPRGWPSTTSDTALQSIVFYITDASGNLSYNGDASSGIYLGKIQPVSGYEVPDYPGDGTAADPVFASPVSAVTVNGVSAPIAQDALILHTEDQSQTTPWSRTNIHAVTAEGVSADGYPAYKVDCNTTAGTHSLGIATTQKTLTDNTNITVFVDAKADERTWIAIGGRTKANVFPSAYFDLSAGTEHTNNSMVEASIESRGTGWYRLRGVFSVASGGTTPGMALWVVEADNDNFFAGLGANDGLLVSRCFAVEGNVAMADADAAYVRAGSTMEYVRDRSSAIVTLPPLTEFTDTGDHVNTGWMRNLPLVVEGLATGDIRVEPADVATNFGNLGPIDEAVYPPAGLVEGDEVYGVVDEGEGTFDPVTCDFVVTSGPLSGTIYGYAVEAGSWVTPRTVSGLEAPSVPATVPISIELLGRGRGRFYGR